MNRLATLTGTLARRGFSDPDRAAEHLAVVEAAPLSLPADWLDEFDHAGDPDQALGFLADLVGHPQLAEVVAERAGLERLVRVLGAALSLGQHLTHYPDDLAVLALTPQRWSAGEITADLLAAVGAEDPDDEAHPLPPDDVRDSQDSSGPLAPIDQMRLANRRHLLRISARDLTSADPVAVVDDIAAELADLADAIVRAALCVARAETPGHRNVRFAVIALGKCGAQELNYISDVDVLYLAEPATEQTSTEQAIATGTKLAAALARACSAHTPTGSIWQIDAALRPEGKAGPLVRSLASMQTYYSSWAKNWEFQAMLKARPQAGDAELAQQFCDLLAPMVWSVGGRENFMSETQAMRQRVVALLPPAQANREIKLSEGGLRDTEFTVQILQLVHGRADERLRHRSTLVSLEALIECGYIGRDDGADLGAAYRFQRVLEHRVQLSRLRRTHLMPDDPSDLRALARQLGMKGADEVVERWRASAVKVRRLHQRVYYSPLLEAASRLPSEELRLSPEAAQDRLRALGFNDPAIAMGHIEALTRGVSRTSEIQRQLMPAMLGWLAEAPNPDAGLLAFRQVSDQLGSTPWYLRALRDEGEMARRLASVLASSRFATDLLKRAPETVQLLATDEDLRPRTPEQLSAAMTATLGRHDDPADAAASVRAIRRRELFRVAAGDLLGLIDLIEVGRALTHITSATVDAAVRIATRDMDHPPRIAVIAMGRWGGAEMSYGSDADAMFVIADSDDESALTQANKVVGAVRALLSAPGPDPALEIDVDLRPEGKGGAMVRTLSSYRTYYERWSDTWEAQALVRADYGAGDREVADALLEVIADLRYPPQGLTRNQLTEIRKLKARMEAERIPRGQNPRRNVKLGPGGLSDVEWSVQVTQLESAHAHPGLRTTETLTGLAAAVDAGLISSEDAAVLETSWLMASKIRNAIILVRSRASDTLPTDARDLAGVAYLMQYPTGQATGMVEDYLRAARHCAGVVDRLLWQEA